MKRRLNILHLTGSLSIGGAQRLILDLARHTNPLDFNVHVFAFGASRKHSFALDFASLQSNFTLIPIKYFYDPRVTLALLRYIRNHRIDLIHTHMILADNMGRFVGTLSGVPVISTMHNHPANYDSQRFDRRWMTRITARFLTTHFVAVSDHIRELFLDKWGVQERRISTICNAISLDEFLGIPEETPSGEGGGVTITNIAHLTPQKAQHLLLDAARVVLDRYPNTRFLIVGRGDLEQTLKEQARTLGIEGSVTFTGMRRDIPQILEESDIFVLSSLWEGLPLTAIEAMAAARPVVLTDVGGNRELFESGDQGLLVPPGDSGALADGLLTLIADRQRRIGMGLSGRDRVISQFGMERAVGEYEALYRSVCEEFH